MSGPRGPRGPLPVAVVAGIQPEARRRAVDRLLHDVPGSVALHHDFSPAPTGTIHRGLRDASGERAGAPVPLVNDCACCALRADLLLELERLAMEEDGVRFVVVELWDSVEPRAIAEAVAAAGTGLLRLSGVLTAVSPALLLDCLANGDDLAEAGLATAETDRRTVGDTWARQLEYPTAHLLVDADAADAEDMALLRQLHPTARRVEYDSGQVAPLALAGFDVAAAAAAQHPACALLPQDAYEAGVATLVWRRRRPFHPGRLHAALEEICCAAVRSRGRFWLADRPDTLLAWDAAGGALCVEALGPWLAALPDAAWESVPPARRVAAALDWHPRHGDRRQHLVFTSPGLDREELSRVLESCLLTDAELQGGPGAWRSFPDAFEEFLDRAL